MRRPLTRLPRFAGVLVVLVVFAAIIPASASSPERSTLSEPKPGCQATKAGYECIYGPIEIHKGANFPPGDYGVVPTPAPPEAGFITWMRATLVDTSGEPVARHAVHLHHAVWLNPNRSDVTCAGWPDRFFASGAERTKVEMPAGFGYFWDNQPPPEQYPFTDPTWLMNYHLDGMHGGQTIYIRLRMGLVNEPTAPPMFGVRPLWLDVDNCSDSEFDVRKGSGEHGRYKRSWSYSAPADGNFVAMAGHLHDGGIKLTLANRTTGEKVFVSRPTYRNGELRKMSSFSDAEGPAISAGDELKLTAVYDDSKNLDGVMGIMMGALATSL